jgi:hypothetical protein
LKSQQQLRVGSASAATSYSVVDLGPSAEFAEAIDDRGDVVGSGSQAFLYSRGALTLLPALGTGAFSTALGVNDRGDVVGYPADRRRLPLERDRDQRARPDLRLRLRRLGLPRVPPDADRLSVR